MDKLEKEQEKFALQVVTDNLGMSNAELCGFMFNL